MRIFFLAILFLGACKTTQLPQEKLSQNPGALLFNGYTKPNVKCYECHNGDATGSIKGPNLIKKLKVISDEKYRATLAEGPHKMPSYTGILSPEEEQLILDWLKSL
jgi:hypothetical protein